MMIDAATKRERNREWMAAKRAETASNASDLDKAFDKILRRLNRHPFNTAPIPLALSWESNEWFVDVHIREDGLDYSIEAHNESLPKALDGASRALSRQSVLKAEATKDRETFGY